MKTKGVCLILTDRCNAECEICCFSCSPKNQNVMNESLMMEIIRQAKELKTVYQIGFSGGEPFLYYDLLKKGLKFAKELGFATSIATNGFWGGWSDEELIEKIQNLPVDQMTLSYDAYHGKYVKEEQFQRALQICKKFDISVSVGIGETKGKGSANSFFKSMGDYKYLMNYYIYPFMMAGRAKQLPEDIFFKFHDEKKLFCSDELSIAIRWDGEVFPCCVQTVFDTQLSLGNINNTSLKNLTEKGEKAIIHEVFRNPKKFSELGRIAQEELGVKLPETCVSPCEICAYLFTKKEICEKLFKYAKEIHNHMITNAFLNR